MRMYFNGNKIMLQIYNRKIVVRAIRAIIAAWYLILGYILKMHEKKMNLKAVNLYLKKIKEGLGPAEKIEDADAAAFLETVKQDDEKKFMDYLDSLPAELRAKTFLELPYMYQIELIRQNSPKHLAEIIEELESDDATDLIQAISAVDKIKENETFNLLSDKKQEKIEQLIHYDENEAGCLMQTELLKVSLEETIQDGLRKLRELKSQGVGVVQYLFIVDQNDKLLKMISIDDLILEDMNSSLSDIVDKYPVSHAVVSHDPIDFVLKVFEKYDMSTLPVVDRMGHLIGRITHDDILDAMQDSATKQIYAINKIHQDEELHDTYITTAKRRANWLFLNLINATMASIVIGLFEKTIDAVITLAILLPIVGNMAGSASVQTMTVIVRQMAISTWCLTILGIFFIKR